MHSAVEKRRLETTSKGWVRVIRSRGTELYGKKRETGY